MEANFSPSQIHSFNSLAGISVLLIIALLSTSSHATTFEVINSCPYTIWAAAVPGGGRRLDRGQAWTINVANGTGRLWGRTNCSFNANGRGKCETGDCNGVLQCTTYGSPPNTLAEYSLNLYNKDFFDISLVDGFNVPMDFNTTSDGCSRGIRCIADINGDCPDELRAPGGCNSPCTVFKNEQHCCTTANCKRTVYSIFFKDRCPDAYSYSQDDQTSTFTCTGTNFRVVFCP